MDTKVYVLTNPADVTVAFQTTAALNFDTHLARLLKNFGVSPMAFEKAWNKPKPGDQSYIPNNPINPNQLDLIHLVESSWAKQLLSGTHMNKLSQVFIDSILKTLHWDQLDRFISLRPLPCLWCGEQCTHHLYRYISLHSLCRFLIVEATTRSLFGNQLHEVEPNVVEIMGCFNDHVWMIVFGYKNPWNNLVDRPRKLLISALKEFIQHGNRETDDVAWAVRMMLQAMEQVEIDLESRASMILMSFWA